MCFLFFLITQICLSCRSSIHCCAPSIPPKPLKSQTTALCKLKVILHQTQLAWRSQDKTRAQLNRGHKNDSGNCQTKFVLVKFAA